MDPSPIPYYPVNEFGPLMKGLVIGGVGILHVFLAQFAIGGGMLLYYFERLGAARRCRTRARSSTATSRSSCWSASSLGALTGVAMWFTTIQVGARTIGLMVDEFHWLWATEWVWFCDRDRAPATRSTGSGRGSTTGRAAACSRSTRSRRG